MSDPHEQGGISVTIKGDEPGGKYNDAKKPGTWIVFHGTPARIREQIAEVFEIEAGERPLYDLINEATDLFKASATVSSGLGGRVLDKGKQQGEQQSAPASNGDGGDVWAQAAAAQGGGDTPPWNEQQAEKKEDADPILVALETCKSVADVQQVWAENQAAFNSNPAYMEAYKAKGKALSSAA